MLIAHHGSLFGNENEHIEARLATKWLRLEWVVRPHWGDGTALGQPLISIMSQREPPLMYISPTATHQSARSFAHFAKVFTPLTAEKR